MDTKTFLGQRSPCRRVADPPRRILAEPVQQAEQALPGAGELAWHLTRRGGEGLERGDGIAEVRREEVHAMVASTPADFGQERVSGGACVQVGDEIDRRRQTLRPALDGETLVAEVLVDVPDPAPLTLRRGRHQPWATDRKSTRLNSSHLVIS